MAFCYSFLPEVLRGTAKSNHLGYHDEINDKPWLYIDYPERSEDHTRTIRKPKAKRDNENSLLDAVVIAT